MKKSVLFGIVILISAVMLSGCKGSGTYRGEWKVTGINGDRFVFHFLEKSLVTTGTSGRSDTVGYTQNVIRIENGIRSYGIHLSNGYQYLIVFPVKSDDTKAKITNPEGGTIFTMGRSAYIDPKEFEQWP
ncbi:MAG: hypothetical protein KL787_09220 [Taibaiella sp.]|nr:hypothetical protein [Taibaiella sp.]